ncbi:MAG: UDP-2,3-diacylglucosamine diphosphatase, partial [Bacteroidota bacterium]
MKTYFVSDAHLGVNEREIERQKERELIRFFDLVESDGKQLFILGDLFDFWFEYRTVIPKGYHRVLAKLSELVEKGIEINYLAGNHDFWLGNFFEEDIGMHVFAEPFGITIGNAKFFLHHGDGLAQKDLGYRIMKKILRNRLNIKLYSWLHPDLGIGLARFSSRKSRNYTSQKDFGEVDGMLSFAAKKIAEGFQYVVMGHNHQPVYENVGDGFYVNLGDWISHYTYG